MVNGLQTSAILHVHGKKRPRHKIHLHIKLIKIITWYGINASSVSIEKLSWSISPNHHAVVKMEGKILEVSGPEIIKSNRLCSDNKISNLCIMLCHFRRFSSKRWFGFKRHFLGNLPTTDGVKSTQFHWYYWLLSWEHYSSGSGLLLFSRLDLWR